MNHKINLAIATLLLSLASCRTETQSVSAINGKAVSGVIANNTKDPVQSVDEKINNAKYKANVSNLLVEMPNISKDINPELSTLKGSIEQYLQAEKTQQEQSYKKYMDSYKAVQNKMYLLTSSQQEYINRYLVPIKTNMSLLKSSNDLLKTN